MHRGRALAAVGVTAFVAVAAAGITAVAEHPQSPAAQVAGHPRRGILRVRYRPDTPRRVTASGGVNYWVDVPRAYDASGRTPMKLFVWLHGCDRFASSDIREVTPRRSRDYLTIADAEREGRCWEPSTDSSKVLADIADVERRFNVDPRQVILGGYSSGGDLAYRMMFYHSNRFAFLLAMNTAPFRFTDSTAARSIAAANRRFPVVHLAHDHDSIYDLKRVVEPEIRRLQSARFVHLKFIIRPGDHYDTRGENGYAGTYFDLRTYLLPHIDDGWRAF